MKKQIAKKKEENEDDDYEDKPKILVKDIMSPNVIWAKPKDTIVDVAKKMYKHKIEAVFILDKGKKKKIQKAGIITSKDIVYKIIAMKKDPNKVTAETIATHGLISIEPGATLEDAAIKMRNNDIRRLPVIDENGVIVGVITESDISRVSPQILSWIMERRSTYKDFISRPESEQDMEVEE